MSVDDTGGDSAVLGSVFSSSRDRKAESAAFEPQDKAPPAPAPEPEAKAPEPEVKAEEAPPEQQEPESRDPLKKYRDPDTGRLVPLNELKTERTKRQEEARLRVEADKRAEEAERRYHALMQRLEQQPPQAPQQQQAPQPPPPDPFTDPEAYAQWRDLQIENRLFATRVHMSERIMRAEKPDYDVAKDAFYQAARRNQQLRVQLSEHPFPAEFAYQVGSRMLQLKEIGDDPAAYRARIEKEAREKVLAELKSGKPANGNAPPPRFPGTLADATSAGDGQGAILTDDAMMGDVFSSSRKRR